MLLWTATTLSKTSPYLQFVLLLVLPFCSLQVWGKRKIVLGVFAPMRTPERDQYGYRLAFQMAINSTKSNKELVGLFSEYDIEMKYIDTYGEPKVALHYLHELMSCTCPAGKQVPSLLLGPALYKVAIVVTEAKTLYSVPQVLYNAVPHNLVDPRLFMNIAANVPSYESFNEVTVRFIQHFKWKKLALFYNFHQDNGWYIQVTDDLTKKLKTRGISVRVEPIKNIGTDYDPAQEIRAKLKVYKKNDNRIFLCQFGAPDALKLFCEAFKLDLYGPKYVWIINRKAGELRVWLTTNISSRPLDCSKEDIYKVAENIIAMDRSELRVDDVTTVTGKTAEQYRQEYTEKRLKIKWHRDGISLASSYAFDSTWLSLLALQGAMKNLHSQNLTLDNNCTKSSDFKTTVVKEIMKQFRKINFQGVTGPVKFDTLGSTTYNRKGVVAIKKMKDGKFNVVEQFFMTRKENHTFNDSLLFPEGVPLDSPRHKNWYQPIPLSLFATLSAGASLGIVMACAFLVFNVYHRKYKFIRLSAPTFNNIIVLGCIMCLSTVYLFGIHVVDRGISRIICKCRAWILTVGFSFAFGAMFVKTWRIYKICTNKRLKISLGPMSDWYLLAIIAGIVFVDVVILFTWETVDPLDQDIVSVLKPKLDPQDDNTVLIPKLIICKSTHLNTWLSLIYVYKGILLLYGLFLAYETRNVAYAHLNDSRTIGVCVYNVVVLSTIGAFMGMVLDHSYFTHLYVIISVCIIFPSSATIGLIFFPKVIFRMKITNPEEDMNLPPHLRTSMDFTSTMNADFTRGQASMAASTNTVCMQINGHTPTVSSPGTTN